MAITFKVGFQADVRDLQNSLQGIQKDIANAFSGNKSMSAELANAVKQAMTLEQALKRATAENGDISYSRFNTELKKAGTTAAQLTTSLAKGGADFVNSLNAANRALATSNRSAITLSAKMKEAARVFTQSFKFTAAQTALREITGSVQSAAIWVKELDASITQIGVVTGKTSNQLDKITENIITGSKELKIAAKEYADGALIFYQQGLNDEEVTRRNEITIKAAKAAGQSVDQMSSQLTAIWNTYGMVGDEQLRAASVGAKMASQTAVDFADIAEAMQSAAAPASQMGVEYNQLAAIIATVGDVTQQSASTIGNAYKTIFSRFQQLKAEGTDGEVTLSSVSSQLQSLGINVLDSAGNLRDLGVVINEVGQNWDNWSQTQQTAIAQIVGGTRQYGQFLALMQNFDKYQANLASANSETGATLEQQYSKALDSIEAKAERASETWRRAFGSLIDEKALKGMYDSISAIGEATEAFLKSFGGLPGILTLVASLLSSKIGPKIYEITTAMQNTALSMSKKGRNYTIERDYKQNNNAIENEKKNILENGRDGNGQLTDESKEAIKSLEIQQKKNTFMKQVALTNEDINNKLKTATGEYRIQLEMQQKLAQAAGDLYQKHLDDLEAIKQQLGTQQQVLQNEERRMRVDAAREVGKAQQDVNKYQEKVDAAGPNASAEDIDKLTAAKLRLADAQMHYKEVLESSELAQKQAEVHTANAASKLLELRTTTDRTSEGYQNLKHTLTSELNGAIEGMKMSLEGLKSTEDGGGQAAKDLEEKINKLTEGLKNLDSMDDTALDGFIEDLREGSSLAGQLSDKTNQILNDAVQTGQNGQAAKDKLDRANQPPTPPKNNNKGFDGKKMVQGLTDITTSAMTVYSSINLATTAIENLGDKPVQSIVQLTTAAGMGFPALMKLGKGLISVGSELTKLVAAHPAIAALVATIAAVAAVSAFFYNEWKNNSPEGQLKKSEEAAEELKNSLAETQQAAEDLRSTFDNYKTARKALDDCIKGTDEWRDALQASNNAALELINSLDGLSGEQIKNLYTMKDGVIEIDEEQMKMLQHQKDAQVNAAQYASMMADNQVSQNKNRVMAKNIGRDYNNRNGQQTVNSIATAGTMALVGAKAGTVIGGALGTVVPVLGNAIGAAAGAAIGGLIGGAGGILGGSALADVVNGNRNKATGDKILDNLDSLRGKTGEELEQALAEIGISAKAGTEEFNSLSKSIEELAMSTDAANEQMRLISKTAVENALGSAYSDAEKAITAEKLDDKQEKIYNDLIKEMKDNFGKFDDGSKDERDAILNRLAEATGNTYSAQSNFSRGTDSDRTFGVLENGEEKEYTMEYIASTIAASEALKGLEVDAQEARAALEGMSNAEKDFIATRSLGGATKSEYDEVIAAASNENGELTQESAQAYFEKIGLSPEDAAAYARDLLASAEIPWDKLVEGLPETLNGIENLTADSAKAFGEQYEKILGDVGEEGVKTFTETMNGITEGLDAEKQKEVFEAMTNIDWSAWDAGDQAIEVLEGMNIEVDASDEGWKKFVSTMRDANNAVVDISGELNKMEAALSAVADIDYGDIISKEDYENLKRYNEELTRYFTILADGSAQFTGDKLDFIQAQQDSKESTYLDLVKQVKENKDELDNQLKEGEQILNGSKVSDVGKSMADSAGAGKYDTSQVQKQLDFLSSQGYNTEEIQKWTDALIDADGNWKTVSTETLAEVGEAVASLNGEFELGPERISNYNDQIEGLYMSYGMMATTMKEAEELANKALENEGLSKNSDEGAKLYDSIMNAGFESRKNTEKWMDMDPTEVQEYSDHLQDLTQSMKKAGKESDILSNDLADNAEAAEDVALYTKKMNQGIDKLADGIEDWSDILKNSSEESEEYSSAMSDIKNAMSDVLGVSEEFLSDDFIIQNMDDIKKAAEGDAEAIDRLAVAAGKDIIMNLGIEDEGVLEQALDLHNALTTMIPDIKVGAVLDGDSEFAKKAAELLETTAMTADQANAYFRSIGFEPNFEFEEVTKEVPGYKTVTVSDPPVWGKAEQDIMEERDGKLVKVGTVSEPYIKEQKTYSYQEKADAIKQTFAVPKMTGEDGKPNANISFTKTNAGAMSNYSSRNSGGGSPGSGSSKSKSGSGSKSKTKDKADKNKYTKRYEDLTNSLERLNTTLDHTKSAMDAAWGQARIRQMQNYNKNLQAVALTQKKLIEETKDYYKLDKQALLETELGQFAKFDEGEFGDLLNPEALRRKLQEMYETAHEALDPNDESSQDIYDKRIEQLDEMQEKLDQFLETHDLLKERVEDQYERIKEWMNNKVEEIQYEIDMRIRIPERDLKQLDRFISRIEDIGIESGTTFDAIQAKWDNTIKEMEAIWGDNGEVKTGIYRALEILTNIDPNNPEHQDYFIGEFGKDEWEKYLEDTSAVPDVVINKIHDLYDQLLDMQESLYDIAQEAFDAIARKIEMWFEKLDKIQDRLDTHLTRLDMLEGILEVSNIKGTQAGRDAQRQINEAKNKNAWTSAHVSDATYIGAKQVYEDVNATYEEILAERNALDDSLENLEQIKSYEFTLKNLKAQRDEAYEKMTAAEQDRNNKIAEAAKQMREILDQELEMLTTEFESGLKGMFSTLEGAMEMFDVEEELRDWYLDPIEAKYEFESLLNKIDKAMEDTTDPETLKKLVDLRATIVQKQEEGKEITQAEFDIDNKRFELLQAEAAFREAEEAKAKNTMRLMRDASGNYSYVYSADEKEADDAKQKLLDAEHDLYEAEKAAARSMDRLYFQQLKYIEELRLKRAQALAEGDQQAVEFYDRMILLATEKLDRIAQDESRFQQFLRDDFGETASQLNTSISAMISGYDTLTEAEKVHKEKLIEYDREITAAVQKMQVDIEKELKELGINYKDLAGTIRKETDEINKENDEMKRKVTEMKTSGINDLKSYTAAINTWARDFISQMDAVIKKLAELQKAIAAAEKKSESDYYQPDYSASAIKKAANKENYSQDIEYRAEKEKLEQYSGKVAPTAVVNALAEKVYNGDLAEQEAYNILKVYNRGLQPDKASIPTFDIKSLMMKMDSLGISFDRKLFNKVREEKWKKEHNGSLEGFEEAWTGGLFTQPDVTRIAEKGPELVLNADDTEKILQAVKLIRGTVQTQLGTVDAKLFAATGRVAEITPYNPPKETDQALEQQVHIEANFPGVSVASEIEEALNNLVVSAAQYRSKYHK